MPRRANSFRSVAVLMLLPIAGLVVFLGYRFLRDIRPAAPTKKALDAAVIAPKPKPAPATTQKRAGEIVLILDDIGFSHQPLGEAMQIDPNLNFAVIPNGARAGEYARQLHARGFEVLCHLPMEPIGYPRMSPGPNAVLTSMSDDEVARITRENVGAVPFAVGVNNHMGSRATADRRVMTSVLSALPKGMYFIDSKTTGGSVAGSLAKEMNIRTASRNVFLDDEQSEAAVRRQLAELADEARSRGVAVGIGHPYPVTVKVLAEEIPKLRTRGFRLLRASAVVE
ncbi:MAG TPA: divergent polysaccharide deacetylase family protein [Thermoanaerobaculia bacterium]|nr:divergent polysaccharide deacetylase family protein [Thermoanaerobaculia bacterium]